MSTRRYGLRDDEWDRIKDSLPGRLGSEGRPAKDNRLFVEAVLYQRWLGETEQGAMWRISSDLA
jgi:hypothetical protein